MALGSVKVSLFATCLVDQLYPEVGVSAVRLLRRLGVEVDFAEEQTCCGQPLFNSGFRKGAAELARRVLNSYQPAAGTQDQPYVVVPSGSCTAMMRRFYPELFEDDPRCLQQAHGLAGRVYEFSEFIVKVLGVTDVGAQFDGLVAYHPSCHLLRELGVSSEPTSLIAAVEGAEPVSLDRAETCCGFGGAFSVKYPDISAAMLRDKLDDVEASGSSVLVSCDSGCLMHIGGGISRRGLNVKPMHIASFLESRPIKPGPVR